VISYGDIWSRYFMVTILIFWGQVTSVTWPFNLLWVFAMDGQYLPCICLAQLCRYQATYIFGYLYYYYVNKIPASFWPNFTNVVAMATKVSRDELWHHLFVGPPNLCQMQGSVRYFIHMPSYSLFCIKFCCHCSQVRSRVNLNGTIRLVGPENHTLEAKVILHTAGVMIVYRIV